MLTTLYFNQALPGSMIYYLYYSDLRWGNLKVTLQILGRDKKYAQNAYPAIYEMIILKD